MMLVNQISEQIERESMWEIGPRSPAEKHNQLRNTNSAPRSETAADKVLQKL